ncbi:guanylate cyclase 1 soluble subunit beta 1 [Rhinolophus ferrumequinum]|uniref:Guanylate cyclase 1 soluble subunit beta 1 n=1 Tax=Rhinolophus ferrumequinum TaxID=59479 RepID=A0A7J7U090_RHIFE|nr:guanylate cyclase 1 soluble subunit beta 1 [Rhinolophus ferrumequinum]
MHPPRTIHLPPGFGHDGNCWSGSSRWCICSDNNRDTYW